MIAPIVAGLLLGVIVFVVARVATTPSDGTVAVTTAPPTSVDDGSPPGLPDGYTAIADRLGIRVERLLETPEGVFVTLSTVAANAFDPEETAGFQGGLWTAVLEDGREIVSTTESFDPLARGTVSVQFTGDGLRASDITEIRLIGTATRLVRTFTQPLGPVTLGEAELTQVRPDEPQLSIDAGVELEIIDMAVGPNAGEFEWRLAGDTPANAFVAPTITFDTEAGSVTLPALVQTSAFTFFHPSIPAPYLVRSDKVAFAPPPDGELPAGIPLQGQLSVDVVWAIYLDAAVAIPTDGAQVDAITR